MENEIKESINFYTHDTKNCQIIKTLIDPIEYLRQAKKTIELSMKENIYSNNLCNFLNSSIINPNIPNSKKYRQNEFIKDKETLYQYLQHIQNILVQGYMNYYDLNYKMPTKLYRAISNIELENLNNTNKINNLWSTSSSLTTTQGYIIETVEVQTSIEYLILEIPINQRIPFIDVDKNGSASFEPNEFILIPSAKFRLSKIKQRNEMNNLGFYTTDNIPIYSAKIQYQKNTINTIHEKIDNLVRNIANNINQYGSKIEEYLNDSNQDKVIQDKKFHEWAKNLQLLFITQQQYIDYCIANQSNSKQLEKELNKIKILK